MSLDARLLGAGLVGAGLGGACLSGCASNEPSEYEWQLPQGFPAPLVPADNPMTHAKVELGRYLFYDPRLSGNGTQSCASCHEQARAFSDGKVLPTGSTGDVVPRNSMSLANVGYLTTYTWANPVLDTLEAQALVPMFGEFPVELGMTGYEEEILTRLANDPLYPPLFQVAFPESTEPFQTTHLVHALASFQRTLISGGSPYDRWVRGDEVALSAAAKRGFDLFFSERTECYHCHAGLNFTTAFRSDGSTFDEGLSFENNGLYDIDGAGTYPPGNTGLIEFTRAPTDMGRFRIPSLRNLVFTAPYMHDGSIATLEEVIDHYVAGGRTLVEGPNAGVGANNPYKSPLVFRLDLTEAEQGDLLEFLHSLSDDAFVADDRFSNPFL